MTNAEECLAFVYGDLLKLMEWANESYRNYGVGLGDFYYFYFLGRTAGIINALSVSEIKSIKLRMQGYENEAKFLRYSYRRDE